MDDPYRSKPFTRRFRFCDPSSNDQLSTQKYMEANKQTANYRYDDWLFSLQLTLPYFI